MRVSFATTKMAKVLNSAKELQRKYGQLAPFIQRRMDTLRASPTLDDVPKDPPDRCHQLSNNRDEDFGVVIKDQRRIILGIDHDPIPRMPDGRGIDLKQVTAVVVKEISDHYN